MGLTVCPGAATTAPVKVAWENLVQWERYSEWFDRSVQAERLEPEGPATTFEDRMRISIPHKRSMKMTAQPNAVPPIPEGSSTVMPWIISRDTAKLLDFMKQAFGAQELSRAYNEDGTIGHAEAKIGDSIVGGFDAREGWPDTPCAPRVCTSKMPMLCTSKPSLLEPFPSLR